ncbi:MAG: LuxR C-terminal-related transcriptional regulator, partial [Streptosporangiaceae bacterium]
MDVLRLVLVDDYRMVTEALASRLSAAPDLWVAGCCQTDDPRLPEVVRWLRPDVVLIDVEPLGIAIAEVLSRIRAAWPDARIIVVSADEEVSHAVDAARAGVDAWVSKSQGADQLETVLRGVARGHSWFPPEMLGEVIRGLRDDVETARESSNLLDTLSPRELDVLTSMAKGKRARQIAAELMISADTVRTHTRSIFGKLEVHSRIEAVSVAWAAGLRPDEPGLPDAESAGQGASPGPAEGRPAAGRERQPGLPGRRGSGSGGSGLSGSGSGRPGSGGPERGGRPAAVTHSARRAQPDQAGQPGREAQTGRDGRPGPGGSAPGMSRLNPGPAARAGRQAGSRATGRPADARLGHGRPAD